MDRNTVNTANALQKEPNMLLATCSIAGIQNDIVTLGQNQSKVKLLPDQSSNHHLSGLDQWFALTPTFHHGSCGIRPFSRVRDLGQVPNDRMIVDESGPNDPRTSA
ncbi:hypothetical protein AcW1_007310 [Taiwanofungus camphoratus]|nr:hypothetical protein AcW2_007621 [Antrodia cinnamomea]KAI0927445.1 hypothetical protein AcV5_007987 [Antrodia cinnamomea]KAI0930739.1 hypothetical protein AcV7_004842 [Antrodia cinnamomea]KAI0952974.1 hypothetical protein AcW1_007310 [Antrodia cinnamomea]